jgi:hypothetical protein
MDVSYTPEGVPTSRTITINGTAQDLSANRSWTISGTSAWTVSGSDIYRSSAVAVGGSSIVSRLHLQGTGATLTAAPVMTIQNTDDNDTAKMGGIQTKFRAASGKYIWNIRTGGQADTSFGSAGIITETMMTCTNTSYNAYTTPVSGAGYKWQIYDNTAYRNVMQIKYGAITVGSHTAHSTVHVQRIGVSDTTFSASTDAKLFVGANNVSGGENQIAVYRNMTNEGASQHHGFCDASTATGAIASGINSYDSVITVSGGTQDHLAGFQFRCNFTGGTTPLVYGFWSGANVTSGTVTTNYGSFAANPTGAGTITNNIAHYVAEQTRGTNNAAFVSRGATGSLLGAASTTDVPVSSALLELKSTTKGLLLPRLTTAERDAISSPAEGLVIYNSTTKVMNFYNGTSWGSV